MKIPARMGKYIYRFVIRPRLVDDPRSMGYLADAHALGITAIRSLQCQDLYFIEGQVNETHLQRLADELLSDPITQTAQWGRIFSETDSEASEKATAVIEVALLPGVTDPAAEQILRAAGVLGISGVKRASTGLRFELQGEKLSDPDLHLLARRLLANPVIQRYRLGQIEPAFPQAVHASKRVQVIPLRGLDDEGLLGCSDERRAALDLAEMQAIQAYFLSAGRDPTDVEFETLAQTWSEHCVHKTFKAHIALNTRGERGEGPTSEIDGLLRTYLRGASEQIAAPWVRSMFEDNAGIIDFDDEYAVSFKVETHNHPSAIEPFGGANTGVGGVIRDVLGVSARPIAATDTLCFGPPDLALSELPEGVLHPRRVRSGVVAGVQDYGNKLGIPTVNGSVLYDPGFTANPLVFCGCVGLAPKNGHPRRPQAGDRVIVLGGATGRDGLRGATFSSMTMNGQTGEVSGASVQIGDPITEKGLIEVIVRARDLGLYHAVTDCGAGGLSSAVGEMSSCCGADVDLKQVRLKYPGLAPWEIWLSEAQERMVLAVPAESVDALQELCQIFDVELTDIGAFTTSGRLVVRYAGEEVLDLANEFLHEGMPQRRLEAVIPNGSRDTTAATGGQSPVPSDFNLLLLDLLSHPNIASKAEIIRLYDHEVQGGTVVKPLTGAQRDGPSDACVLKPQGTRGLRGIVLSNGINPEFGKWDTYAMAVSAVDEAIRNAVAVGANPARIALLDNFCWGDPKRPETLGSLVEAVRGCYEAALHYKTPFISGKDSLNNEYMDANGQRHAIPPSLLISAIGIIDDIRQAVTMDLKSPGNRLYLLGEHIPTLSGSYLAQRQGWQGAAALPGMPCGAPALYRDLHGAIQSGLVQACHDLSEGGLAVAAAEMCIAGRLGLNLNLESDEALTILFGEVNGCLLVEVAPQDCASFEHFIGDSPFQDIGSVTSSPLLKISILPHLEAIALGVEALAEAFNGST
jgi:phosphoribosylformylglycinamidine synthase II